MSLALPVAAGSSVLVTRPGARVAETVHALAAQGVHPVVRPDATTPDDVLAQLHDLAGRGLLRVDPEAEADGADVVLRDPHTPAPEADRPQGSDGIGRVTLVGGGPGDPGLLTTAGLAAVERADVLVCDRLAPLAVLSRARPDAEVVHVGKIPRGAFTPQEAIDALLVERASRGLDVVRLKGGDGFVFGRGGEEWNACVRHGIPVTVVPGVSSAVAAPALAGIPVTHRALTQGFVVVSGHVGPDDPRSEVDWGAIARCGLTLVVLMGNATFGEIADELVRHGMPADTPSACVAEGSLPGQQTVRAPLAGLADATAAAGVGPPSVAVVGAVVDALEQPT
ncbi:uroporphyrinogen-III C-methyltransferase [Phycicoccus sp. CSK15P-2]|uniref:uroporphyrinogen-III C-methyltransferase n=1 Tax=Phycicoccus sp. CSK15P-2 TaxID=2807627 RepID=UPI001950A102|nr:uroporphyrinogen-III C-methyltransferase [Phycicoccus sp. CSK15P-2]MBM6404218.1 uroporphyrinogen-III C-methyltransferase [Phycicoccus sp. CSK15P-2]